MPFSMSPSPGACLTYLVTSLPPQQLSAANTFSAKFGVSYPLPLFYTGILSRLRLHGTHACCHTAVSSCEQFPAVWKTVFLWSSTTSGSSNLPTPSSLI